MEAPDRQEREYELAAAILILWMIFDAGGGNWNVFAAGFNERVRPILTRIYGVARVSLAHAFGHSYQTVTNVDSGAVSIQVPNLRRTIDFVRC